MLLQARGRVTAPALAQALQVSARTILRDMDEISAAGVPLYAERGRQGGFQLREGWSTQLTGMTEAEAQALLLAGLPGPATELGLGAAAASARLKMVASLPSAWREQAERVGQRLHIDPVDWYRAPDTPRYLREVADAVWHARSLSVAYESWRGLAQRELEPLGLVLKAGAWYVLARPVGGEGLRTYRLASLRHLTVGRRTFKRPRGFDLASAWQASAARFEAELRQLPARLRVSPRGLSWLAHARVPCVVVPASAQNFVPVQKPVPEPVPVSKPHAAAGWQEVQITVESVAQGARQLLAYGAEIEVLAPATLRAEVLLQARQLVLRHRRAFVSTQKP